jgi:Sulfotransferase family
MIRPTLIHIHIPKTAGTTINTLLGDAIRGKHFAYSLPGHRKMFEAMSQDERDRIDFIFGHFPYGLHKFFTRPVRYIASLREPRQRLLSFYHYVLSTESHPKHELVKEKTSDFSSFLRLALKDQDIRAEVDNVQVRMIAGKMELLDEYDGVLAAAFANIVAGDFFVGDMERVGEFTACLEHGLQLKCGPIPRLNASTQSVSFEEEMARLAPDVRDILERFCRWDSILRAVVRDVAPGDWARLSPPPAMAATAAAGAEPAVAEDTFVAQVVGALYRVLLLREPDPIGLESRIAQIRGGWTIENVMRQILRSREFAGKQSRFLETYLGAAANGGAPAPQPPAASAGAPVPPPKTEP